MRAGILLALASGASTGEAAQLASASREVVRTTLIRYQELGVLESLDDRPRPGRAPVITSEARLWIIEIACQKPLDLGYPHEIWTLRLLARHIREHCVDAGHSCLRRASPSTVWFTINGESIKPHKISYYLERRDPNFEKKKDGVIDAYIAAEMVRSMPDADLKVVVLSYDEKPGIQAVEKKAPDLCPEISMDKSTGADNSARGETGEKRGDTNLPPSGSSRRLGQKKKKKAVRARIKNKVYKKRHRTQRTIRRDYEYIRHGTISLFAALNLVTGLLHHVINLRSRSSEFIEFLKHIDSQYQPDILICILLDNHSSHVSKQTKEYLATKSERFELVYLPTHASWLNTVETYFSKMSRSVLRHIRVSGIEELSSRISQYISMMNAKPSIPNWTYGGHKA